MFESFRFGKKAPLSLDLNKESPKKINGEEIDAEIINKAEKEHYEKEALKTGEEFDRIVFDMKVQRREANEIINFVNDCIAKNPDRVNKAMSLDQFFDFIDNDESDLSSETIALAGSWVNKYNKEIDPGKPLEEFLNFVIKKAQEANFLLNPNLKEKLQNTDRS